MENENNIVESTESPEEVVSGVLTEEKKAEIAERIRKVKDVLDTVEAQKKLVNSQALLEKMTILSEIHKNTTITSGVISSQYGRRENEELASKIELQNYELVQKINRIYDLILNRLELA